MDDSRASQNPPRGALLGRRQHKGKCKMNCFPDSRLVSGTIVACFRVHSNSRRFVDNSKVVILVQDGKLKLWPRILNVWIALFLAVGSKEHLNTNDVPGCHKVAYVSALETQISHLLLVLTVLFTVVLEFPLLISMHQNHSFSARFPRSRQGWIILGIQTRQGMLQSDVCSLDQRRACSIGSKLDDIFPHNVVSSPISFRQTR
mmetsp:Transcript_11646/g.24004  ORF Transcript_11646/g.24004 Transcript_11646/m.24004 type:complete len:203 (-) Transcript_11646:180-788(-)